MLLSIQNLKDSTVKNTLRVEKTKGKGRISKEEVRRRIKNVHCRTKWPHSKTGKSATVDR